MASRGTYSCGDVFSKEDLSFLARSLKDEKFRALFAEYAKEVCEPENRKQFEIELQQLEIERGVEAVFVHPSPGFALAVGGQSGGPAFVNVCSSDVVQRPSYVNVDDGVKKGQNWSLPHALPKPRREFLNKRVRVSRLSNHSEGEVGSQAEAGVGSVAEVGRQAVVYDVVFHPEALLLSSMNHLVKCALIQTAIDSLSKTFQLKIDQPQEVDSVNYVGKPMRSVIKRVVDIKLFEASEKMSFQNDERTSGDLRSDKMENKVENKSTNSVMEVAEPIKPQYKIKHVSKVDLQDFSVQLIPQCGRAWRPQTLEVEVDLPGVMRASQVDANVWPQSILLSTKSKPQYKLELPLPYPVDEDSSAAKFDVSTQKLTLTLSVIPARKRDQASVHDYSPSDSGIDCDPDYRTNSDGDNSSEVSVSSQEDRLKEVEAVEEEDNVFESAPSERRATLIPSYSVKQSEESLCVILNCGNVLPSSVTTKQVDDQTVNVELSSIGGGHTLLHYGLKVVSSPHIIAKSGVTCKLGDGTVEINIKKALLGEWESCQIGDEHHLASVVLTPVSTLNTNTKSSQNSIKSIEGPTNKCVATAEKTEKKKDGSEDSTGVARVPRMSRTVSMCETGSGPTLRLRGPTCSWPRGILKRRTRSLSESNVGSITSMTPLVPMSSCTILDVSEDKHRVQEAEEGEESVEESISSSLGEKKSVRFNEVVSRQLFRSNSSILGQRAKNQKKAMRKRKCLQRRASESDRESDRSQHSSDPGSAAVSTSTDEDTDTTTTDTTEVEDDLDDISLTSISLDVENNNNVSNNDNSHIHDNSNANIQSISYQNDKENINNNNNMDNSNNNNGIDNKGNYDGFIVKTSKKKRKSKKSSTFEPSNNFIFELDIDN